MVGREAVVADREGNEGRSEAERAAAFARLADRTLAPSYRLAALLLGNESEAQDAVQDAALLAWDRFADLQDPARFEAWFGRILVNGCRDRLRQRRRVRTLPMDDVPELPAPDGLPRLVERDALRRSLAELNPDQRAVVVLHYFAGLSLEEIAERTGARPGTVKSRLHAALEVLHAAYDAAGRTGGGSLR
jgi:RNA polymerase sigma-70 factor (ECF subfamily)